MQTARIKGLGQTIRRDVTSKDFASIAVGYIQQSFFDSKSGMYQLRMED